MVLSLAQKVHILGIHYIFINNPKTSMTTVFYITLSMDISSLLDAHLTHDKLCFRHFKMFFFLPSVYV